MSKRSDVNIINQPTLINTPLFSSGLMCVPLAEVERVVVMTVRSERGLETEARSANTSFRVLEHRECGCRGGEAGHQQRRQGSCPGAGCDQAGGRVCPARWANTLHLVMFTALGKQDF